MCKGFTSLPRINTAHYSTPLDWEAAGSLKVGWEGGGAWARNAPAFVALHVLEHTTCATQHKLKGTCGRDGVWGHVWSQTATQFSFSAAPTSDTNDLQNPDQCQANARFPDPVRKLDKEHAEFVSEKGRPCRRNSKQLFAESEASDHRFRGSTKSTSNALPNTPGAVCSPFMDLFAWNGYPTRRQGFASGR